jgi:hypothetical protein
MLLKTLCFGASGIVLAVTSVSPMVLYTTITLNQCQAFFFRFLWTALFLPDTQTRRIAFVPWC